MRLKISWNNLLWLNLTDWLTAVLQWMGNICWNTLCSELTSSWWHCTVHYAKYNIHHCFSSTINDQRYFIQNDIKNAVKLVSDEQIHIKHHPKMESTNRSKGDSIFTVWMIGCNRLVFLRLSSPQNECNEHRHPYSRLDTPSSSSSSWWYTAPPPPTLRSTNFTHFGAAKYSVNRKSIQQTTCNEHLWVFHVVKQWSVRWTFWNVIDIQREQMEMFIRKTTIGTHIDPIVSQWPYCKSSGKVSSSSCKTSTDSTVLQHDAIAPTDSNILTAKPRRRNYLGWKWSLDCFTERNLCPEATEVRSTRIWYPLTTETRWWAGEGPRIVETPLRGQMRYSLASSVRTLSQWMYTALQLDGWATFAFTRTKLRRKRKESWDDLCWPSERSGGSASRRGNTWNNRQGSTVKHNAGMTPGHAVLPVHFQQQLGAAYRVIWVCSKDFCSRLALKHLSKLW